MVAWAQYIPDMSIQINNSPPAGQYQPVSGQEDTFLHLTFDFPLLDWGRRYRGVQTARMQKPRPSTKWPANARIIPIPGCRPSSAWPWLKLSSSWPDPLRHGRTAVQGSPYFLQRRHGTAARGGRAQEAMTNARIAYIEAELEYKLANLEWMYVANLLQERFLGLPAKEFM